MLINWIINTTIKFTKIKFANEKTTIALLTIVNAKWYLSAGTLLKPELSRSQIKQKFNTLQHETKLKSFYWRCFWLQRICSDWTKASKGLWEKTASCISNLLLDFENYLKHSSKKLQFFLWLFTVKATCTVPKAVEELSRGNMKSLIFLLGESSVFWQHPVWDGEALQGKVWQQRKWTQLIIPQTVKLFQSKQEDYK